MIKIDDCVLVIIDQQDKLVQASESSDNIVINTAKLAKAADILSIPTIVTEQYPQGLGETAAILKNNLPQETVFVEKTSFSAVNEAEFAKKFSATRRNQILLCGIETHICVLQTALGFMEKGLDVYIIKDCCSSRHQKDHETAIELLRQYGAGIINIEIALFDLIKTSKHPNFKEIQALIK